MRRTFVTSGWLLALLAGALSAAEPQTKTLADVDWLVGVWRNVPGERMTFEEHWTAPAAGGMMGMFRLMSGDKVAVYEYLLLEASDEGVTMRMRHYRPGLVDADPAPIRLKLAEASKEKLVFENLDNDKLKRVTYAVNADGQLTVSVETIREDKPTTFTLRFQRDRKRG